MVRSDYQLGLICIIFISIDSVIYVSDLFSRVKIKKATC